MPELPEVEAAAVVARRALVGRVLVAVTTHHAAQRRSLPPRAAQRLESRRVVRIERHAKHQHIVLDDGAIVAVHFRMNGDWQLTRAHDPLPQYARIVFATTDGTRLCLVDSRALCTATYHAPGAPPSLDLGPEPDALTAGLLRDALAHRAGPIKSVLLNQRVVAGLGNIYVAEALWRARLHPAHRARTLSERQVQALVRGIKAAIADGFARQGRYRAGRRDRPFKVYDREGFACPRCRTKVERMTQAGRSTYWCPRCQSDAEGKRR
ncbi:MAG: DNA-formamidopyrimidine glycosylase family protein [Gemmatimonadaceae bacterium]|nr:DNA-formamidopyrimidine glycosylase family protein [Gemmatimonadaceae bacterium]